VSIRQCLIPVCLLFVAGRAYPQCQSNCVITNPTGNQTIHQPTNTSLNVNRLVGNNTTAASFTFGANPNVDLSSWNPAMLRIGRTVKLQGGSGIGSANEFGAVIHMLSNPTSSTASTRRMASLFEFCRQTHLPGQALHATRWEYMARGKSRPRIRSGGFGAETSRQRRTLAAMA
jgi:hypothetical protein